MTIVPDGSFFTRALVPSQRLPEAEEALDDLLAARTPLVAPPLLPMEVASTLRRLQARGSIDGYEASEVWAFFRRIEVAFEFDIAWVERAIEIARAAGLSKVYDSIYLACAEALDAELVTCDEKFAAALPPALRSRVRLIAAGV